jgi:hypothetical protein
MELKITADGRPTGDHFAEARRHHQSRSGVTQLARDSLLHHDRARHRLRR